MKVATIQLGVAGTTRQGRAFLDRALLVTVGVEELERRFAEHFANDEDEARLKKIEHVLRAGERVRVDVHPGESAPPEYHVYFRDPTEPESRLFACVLAPEAVTATLLGQPPHLLFENATFQAMSSDTSTTGLLCAVETWIDRLFPEIKMPPITLSPWPIMEVIESSETPLVPKPPIGGALPLLEARDYPFPEELSA